MKVISRLKLAKILKLIFFLTEKFRLDAFLHFIKGTLCLNPLKRYSVDQALAHPFVTGEPFSGTWTPPDHILGIYSLLMKQVFLFPHIESEIQETQGLSLTAIIAQHCKQVRFERNL